MSANTISYRHDIDGLRAFAVLTVVLFHSGVSFFSGGYVGVDVFFVISGYLITSLIYTEVKGNRFSFIKFYERRIARILPSALITLIIVLLAGFIFLSPDDFKSLGEDTLFSAIGVMNIHLGQGVDYFSQEHEFNPLVHFWSLGVEEQFYVIWPIVLLMAVRFSVRLILLLAFFLCLASLGVSVYGIDSSAKGSYYLLQYRAFELLIGAICALIASANLLPGIRVEYHKYISTFAVLFLVVPVFLFDAHTAFPGVNALWPCIGAAIVLLFPSNGWLNQILSYRYAVFIGLVSYPLYLYHQPVLAFLEQLKPGMSSWYKLSVVLVICLPLSWATWAYVERPVRRTMKSKSSRKKPVLWSLVAGIPILAGAGAAVVWSDGMQVRLQYLNPFASSLIEATSRTFHSEFKGGYQVGSDRQGRVLFVGDSTMQQYVVPMVLSKRIDVQQVDTVTRGGCVLLKGVEFIDNYAGSSCNDLRSRLYATEKKWDTVVISQNWRTRAGKVKNFRENESDLERWTPFVDATIDHFRERASKVIVIGDHAQVVGTENIKPNLFIDSASYNQKKESIQIKNKDEMSGSVEYFHSFIEQEFVGVINPVSIFCDQSCQSYSEQWSYFRDRLHISKAANEYVSQRLTIVAPEI